VSHEIQLSMVKTIGYVKACILSIVAVWCSDSPLSYVAERRARLVLGWVTVRGFQSYSHHLGIQLATMVNSACPSPVVSKNCMGVNRQMWYEGVVSVDYSVSWCLVTGWGLWKQRWTLLYGPMWLEKVLYSEQNVACFRAVKIGVQTSCSTLRHPCRFLSSRSL